MSNGATKIPDADLLERYKTTAQKMKDDLTTFGTCIEGVRQKIVQIPSEYININKSVGKVLYDMRAFKDYVDDLVNAVASIVDDWARSDAVNAQLAWSIGATASAVNGLNFYEKGNGLGNSGYVGNGFVSEGDQVTVNYIAFFDTDGNCLKLYSQESATGKSYDEMLKEVMKETGKSESELNVSQHIKNEYRDLGWLDQVSCSSIRAKKNTGAWGEVIPEEYSARKAAQKAEAEAWGEVRSKGTGNAGSTIEKVTETKLAKDIPVDIRNIVSSDYKINHISSISSDGKTDSTIFYRSGLAKGDDDTINQKINNYLQENGDKNIKIDVYNTKTKQTEEIVMTASEFQESNAKGAQIKDATVTVAPEQVAETERSSVANELIEVQKTGKIEAYQKRRREVLSDLSEEEREKLNNELVSYFKQNGASDQEAESLARQGFVSV